MFWHVETKPTSNMSTNTNTRSFVRHLRTCCLATVVLLFLGTTSAWSDNWHQAAGPNHNFVVQGYAPSFFSVSTDKNILWRTALPNTGQGTVILSGNHAFVMSHAPVKQDTQTGSLCVGQAFDAITGEQRWQRDIPGVREIDLSSLFSDNTAASPATDGTHICFVNVGGSIQTFDFDGNQVWSYAWTPFGRHHSRQHEPLIFDDHLVVVQTPQQDLPLDLLDKEKARSVDANPRYWTHLQSFNVKTGKRQWVAEAGTSIHSTSLFGHLANGQAAILTGRGGGHNPLEKPYGLSLVNADNGKSIWDKANLTELIREVRTVDPAATGFPIQHFEVNSAVEAGFKQASVLVVIALLILVFLDFRDLRYTLLAMFPLAMGLAWTWGLFSLARMHYTSANIIAFPLILGIAIDSGVHILHRYKQEQGEKVAEIIRYTGKAVLLSGFTTMAGFGALTTASSAAAKGNVNAQRGGNRLRGLIGVFEDQRGRNRPRRPPEAPRYQECCSTPGSC